MSSLRWIERDKKMVLQAEVHIAGVSGWQDVPTHQEPKKMTVEDELAEVLHNARHMNSGLSEREAKENWNQHTEISQQKVWGGVSKAAIEFFRARMPKATDGWLCNEKLAYEKALKDVRQALFGEA